MREIKFRAWEKNLKEMIHVQNIDFVSRMINTILAWRLFDEIELMQYTGLNDKNGKEIYEGDIVQGKATFDNGAFEYKGKVVFYTQNNVHGWHVEDAEGGAWELKQLATRISLDHITGEIIGNIYKNPELLEVAE